MVMRTEKPRLFVQPGTEIASERHVSCLRLGQASLNLSEPVSPLTDPLLAKSEMVTRRHFGIRCLIPM